MNRIVLIIMPLVVSSLLPFLAQAEGGVSSSVDQQAIAEMLADTGKDPVMNEYYPSMTTPPVQLPCVDGVQAAPSRAVLSDFVVLTRATAFENPIAGKTAAALTQFNNYLNRPRNKRMRDLMDTLSTFGPGTVYAAAQLILLNPGIAASVTSDAFGDKHKIIKKGWKKADGAKRALEGLGHAYHAAVDNSVQQKYCPHRLPLLMKACNKAFNCSVLFMGKPTTDVNLTVSQIDAVRVSIRLQSATPKKAGAAHAVDALSAPKSGSLAEPKKTDPPAKSKTQGDPTAF